MSLYDKASLVQIPSGVKSGTLYNVVPNTADGDFDFTRGSSATRVNKDGLIETVASGVPRLDYPLLDGVVQDCPALLLEPSRTNSLPESENFSTNWVAIDTTLSSGISSPDGGTNAYSLIEGTGTGGKIIYDTISVSAGSVTYSLFMKKGDKRYTALLLSGVVTTSMFNVDLENGTGTTATGSFDNTNIEQYPNGWYRISVTATATAGNLNCNVYLMNGSTYNDRTYTGNGTDKTYIFGAQLEAGSYPTSYIPTSGQPLGVTRSADVCNNAQADFNDSEGVLFAEISSLEGDDNYISLSDSTTSNRLVFGYDNSIFRVFKNGTNTFNTTSTPYDVRSLFNKIALKYSDNQGTVIYANGFLIDTGSDNLTTSGLSELAFDSGTGVQNFYGKSKQVMTFNEALSDTELENLTSWDSFREMATEQLYSIE